MKKILFIMLLSVCVFAQSGSWVKPNNYKSNKIPCNVFYKTIGDGSVATDSLDSAAVSVHGPYSLSKNANHPMATGMVMTAPNGVLVSGDSLEVAYQFTLTNNLSDTISANWTVLDTITSKGIRSDYVVLDSLPSRSVFYKLTNVDDTGIRIQKDKEIRVGFIENVNFLTKQ